MPLRGIGMVRSKITKLQRPARWLPAIGRFFVFYVAVSDPASSLQGRGDPCSTGGAAQAADFNGPRVHFLKLELRGLPRWRVWPIGASRCRPSRNLIRSN